MPDGYGTHRDYIGRIDLQVRSRQQEVEVALKDAFAGFIESRSVDVVIFSNVGVMDLANAIRTHPIILKPLLTVCNIAGRAIERDLQIKINKPSRTPHGFEETRVVMRAGNATPFPSWNRVRCQELSVASWDECWRDSVCSAVIA
jgi:hypothetical protein